MIWDKKRYAGVQVYVGRKDSEFPGEYIVVYKCNGARRSYGEMHYDAAVGMMYGDIIPNCMSSVAAGLLGTAYREVSQRRIPEKVQRKLEKWVTE